MTAGAAGPPRDLQSALRRHAPALHRSAVMLTGDADAADRLLAAVLTHERAGGDDPVDLVTGPRDVLLGELVREYVRGQHHQRADRAERPGRDADAGDVLRALAPRARAAVMLMHVERWSAKRTADTVGVRPRRLRGLVPGTDGLAAAMDAVADQHRRPPGAVVAGVLTALAAGQDTGAAAPRTGPRAPHTSRRRRAGAITLAVAGLVAALLLVEGDPRPGPRDPSEGGAAVAAVSDLTQRGWVLDPAGRPPAGVEGLALLETRTIDYAAADAPLTLDTIPPVGTLAYAALWCDMPVVDPNVVPPSVTLTLGEERVDLTCAGKDGDPPVARLVPVPPLPSRAANPVRVSWAGDLPARGTAVLATYMERSGTGGRPTVTPALPPEAGGAVVLDPTSVHVPVDALDAFVQRVRITPESRLSVWSGQAGSFMLFVDGVLATDDGDAAVLAGSRGLEEVWATQDPDLRDGWWVVHSPPLTREFAVPEPVRPAAGQTREVTVQLRTAPTAEYRWQVLVTDASPVEVDLAPLRPTPTGAPEVFQGHRLAGAWTVPVTAYPYPLKTASSLSPDTVFVMAVPSDDTFYNPSWRQDGVVMSDRGAASMPNGWDVTGALTWFDEWRGWHGAQPGGPASGRQHSRLGTVSAAVMRHSYTGEALVLAYEPIP